MSRRTYMRWSCCLLAVAAWHCAGGVARAQPGRVAISGRPFGVAHLEVPLSPGADPEFLSAGAIELIEKNGRIFYPVLEPARFEQVLSDVLGDGSRRPPRRLNVAFLFTGEAPLELTILTPEAHEVILTPAPSRRPRDYQRALEKWWRSYHALVRRQQQQGDYRLLVQTYLTSMLSGRLGLRPPLLTRLQQPDQSELQQTIELLMGTESLRESVMRQTMSGAGLGETATITVPPDLHWQPLHLPQDGPPTEVEPIALRVPHECFYVRFGSFTNYLWFDHLKDDYGGDLSRMITLRGHNSRVDEKVQRQLALKQSALAEVMGPQVISDVALIGRDLYMQEGPALGVLFESSNTQLLTANLTNDRQQVLRDGQADGASLETISIAGHDVSLLSTPDNRLRSFYAVDGNYHLVTTSRTIVERFYDVASGEGSLGASDEFQHARREMPLEREDTIFAYFSAAFFRGLLSPQYQIELTRRLQSATDMELVQLAQLAAFAEGQPHETIDELIAGGLLPRGFGQRAGGGPPLVAEHGFVDPQRGARGTFTPIPDVPLTSMTPTEARLFNQTANFLRSQWPQMDPLMVGIKRFALGEERLERIVIDANVSPFAEEKYGWIMSMVGPSTDVQIQSDPNDVITAQMSLQGGLLWPTIPAHHLILGVQDVAPQIEPIPSGFLQTLKLLQTTPGYLGAWPQLGLLDLFSFLAPEPDLFGFSPLPLGLWRWQGDGFSVLSFHQNVLAEAANHLQPVPNEKPAQIRVRVSDLAHSQLADWISYMNYHRAQQASMGNVRLLNTLIQQLRVDPADALPLANRLLDTELICTLGGAYECSDHASGLQQWRSTAWEDGNGALPDAYTAPLLEWFRGASVDLTKQQDQLFLHAELDMLRKERAPAIKLPLFNLFGGKPDAEPPNN